MRRSKGTVEKAIWGSLLSALAPVLGCLGVIIVTVIAVMAAAGSIVGWLFGGGQPTGEGSLAAPGGEVRFWTPTPIPEGCFITPVPQKVTVPPATPGGTPGETWIPTATPCPPPPNNWPTPAPNSTPPPPGTGPRGSPYRAQYVFTQPYGCTDFPEFYNQSCASATEGRRPWFHRGVDMATLGSPTIYSTIEGTVTYAGWGDDGFGNRVYLKSGEYLVIYPHLSRVLVGTGQVVGWGEPIGIEGTTGYSTGNHLHYEIHINGAWVDSTPFLYR